MTTGRRSDGAHRSGVAIVGMACRFAGAPDVDTYWSNILTKVDAITDPPPEAWDPGVYFDGEFEDEDRVYCQRGGYLGELASFAPLDHGIPPVTVGGEPDQWLALQVAHEALADAGALELDPEIRERAAIILGKGTYLNGGNAIALQRGLVVGQTIDLIRQLHPEHSEAELERLRGELRDVLPPLTADTVAGLIPNIIVGRIANRLDLMGPAYTVDAACASSLVAVRHAVNDLEDGECDLALAGGSQVWMPVATQNLFCRLGALSRSQRLRAFDAAADGTLLGEGIGVVVLKRVADAERDGDRIYAVIRGTGVSSDGRGVSVMAPRGAGQEAALRRAYREAGLDPRTVGLIEAHGTGTPVGDATEIHSLTAIFGEREHGLAPTAIGSVKSMISHTIPAAGVASLIKCALSLHHRVLPPTLGVDEPNPALGLERSPFYVNTETRPWIHGGAEPRRAGINAFGFGGINAHAVLEEHSGADGRAAARDDHARRWPDEVCVLEAASAGELAGQATELADALAGGREFTLTDLAATLAAELGTIERPVRLAIVAESLEQLRERLVEAAAKLSENPGKRIRTRSGTYYEPEPLGRDGQVVCVFPGEGSQYPGMLADLCQAFPEARAVFDRIDRLYRDHPRGHVLSDWVFPRPVFSDAAREADTARLMELDIAVESVLTANAAVFAVVRRLVPGVDAIVGHSTGEHSAAMAAGLLDLDSDAALGGFCLGLHDAWTAADGSGQIADAVLLALGTDAGTARRIAEQAGGGMYLAMDNCLHQVVLSGEPGAAARAREIATAEGIMCETLPYDRAVHTPLFAPYADQLRPVFEHLGIDEPAIPLWSCTSAAPLPSDPGTVRELLVEHWTSPVRFTETIAAMHEAGARVFIETGARGNLTAFISDVLRGRPHVAVAADTPARSGTTQIHHLVGVLAAHGVTLDLAPLYERRVDGEPVDWRAPAPPPEKPKFRMELATRWPALRLSDDALERWRDSPAAVDGSALPSPPNGTEATPAAPADRPLDAEITPAVTPEAAHAPTAPLASHPSNPTGVPDTPPAPGPAAPLGALADDAAAVMAEHLRTMESFMRAGSEVMQAYLGAAGAPAGLPVTGDVVAEVPGSERVTRRVIELEGDTYLYDHTLGRDVSPSDPGLTALAIVPLAMTVEMLAEAAAELMPGRMVVGLRDIRAHRWVSVPDGPRSVELVARRLPEQADGLDHVTVTLTPLDEGPAAGPLAQATVVLGDGYPEAPQAAPLELPDGVPGAWAPGRLYDEAMFHGPLWQGVEELESVGAGGVRARLRALPRPGLLAGDSEPEFVLDPVLLDAAGQLVGFWTAQRLSHGRVVFPFRVAALDLFAPPPAAGEQLTATAAITLVGDELTSAEIDVAGADGRSRMRLSGWDDKRFPVPDRFTALTRPAALGALSEPWSPAGSAGRDDMAGRRIDARLGAGTGLWEQVWASRVLSGSERALLATLTMPPRRRLEWLGARTAAKDAVASLLAGRAGLVLTPAEIEILPDADGRPVVYAPGAAELGIEALVSLTHSEGRAGAIAWLVPAGSPAGVGLDAEPMRPRPEGFDRAALRDDERALLNEFEAADLTEWVLRCWCAKEAAGKAMGTGVLPGSRAPVVRAVDAGHETVLVEVAGVPIEVRTARDDDQVVALATCQTMTEVR